MAAALELLDFSDLEVTREIVVTSSHDDSGDDTRDVSGDDVAMAKALAASLPSWKTRAASPVGLSAEPATRPVPRSDVDPPTQRAPRISEVLLRPRACASVISIAPCVFGAPPPGARGSEDAFLAELGENDARFVNELAELQARIVSIESCATHEAASIYAATTLRTYAGELSDLRDAVFEVLKSAKNACAAGLVGSTTSLGVYLTGTYLFASRFSSALSAFACTVEVGEPDWSMLAARVASASQMHFHCLAEQIRADIKARESSTPHGIVGPTDLGSSLEELFFTAYWLVASAKRDLSR